MNRAKANDIHTHQLKKEFPKINLPQGDHAKPFFSFDLDGVIGTPLLGLDWTLGRNLHNEELLSESVKRVDLPAENRREKFLLKFRDVGQQLRYFGRKPMPGAQEGLAKVSQYRNLVIITGRSFLAKKIVENWLKRYQLDRYILGVYANFTDQPTRRYKLYLLREFGITEHADDDGAIIYYLAQQGIPNLYLRDWPRNFGLPYPGNVVHFMNISEIARDLEKRQRDSGGELKPKPQRTGVTG